LNNFNVLAEAVSYISKLFNELAYLCTNAGFRATTARASRPAQASGEAATVPATMRSNSAVSRGGGTRPSAWTMAALSRLSWRPAATISSRNRSMPALSVQPGQKGEHPGGVARRSVLAHMPALLRPPRDHVPGEVVRLPPEGRPPGRRASGPAPGQILE
jgi:hypothetical protein